MRHIATFFIFCISLSLISCGDGHSTIPLDKVDPILMSTGSEIVRDILKCRVDDRGTRSLLNKDYMTPMVHARIVRYSQMYKESFAMLDLTIGKVKKYQLFQVVNKGAVKSMRYKLECSRDDMKFVELKLDINLENNLADFYLYVTSKDGTLNQVNIMPQATNK